MNDANYQKYLEIWTHYYTQNPYGFSVEVAASYAAMDNINQTKNWPQEEIDDDIEYWAEKVGLNTKGIS